MSSKVAHSSLCVCVPNSNMSYRIRLGGLACKQVNFSRDQEDKSLENVTRVGKRLKSQADTIGVGFGWYCVRSAGPSWPRPGWKLTTVPSLGWWLGWGGGILGVFPQNLPSHRGKEVHWMFGGPWQHGGDVHVLNPWIVDGEGREEGREGGRGGSRDHKKCITKASIVEHSRGFMNDLILIKTTLVWSMVGMQHPALKDNVQAHTEESSALWFGFHRDRVKSNWLTRTEDWLQPTLA